MIDLQIQTLEARRVTLMEELQRVESQLRQLRSATCGRCGDAKVVQVATGMYSGQAQSVPCPACV